MLTHIVDMMYINIWSLKELKDELNKKQTQLRPRPNLCISAP